MPVTSSGGPQSRERERGACAILHTDIPYCEACRLFPIHTIDLEVHVDQKAASYGTPPPQILQAYYTSTIDVHTAPDGHSEADDMNARPTRFGRGPSIKVGYSIISCLSMPLQTGLCTAQLKVCYWDR